jgi:putative flippase GtrA
MQDAGRCGHNGSLAVAAASHGRRGYHLVAMRRRLRYAAPVQTAIRRHATPERIRLLGQFLQFGLVGVFGFMVDTSVVYATRHQLGLYGAGVAGFVVAATGNWVLNRLWTFRGQGSGPLHREWARYMAANLGGFVLNRGTYAILVTFVAACADQPVLAVAAGSIAGMGVNFVLSRAMVFR